ncbi:MAG: ABC transporter permease [Cyclobacteriaceae bacterium]|nr:MAG: ABC transporter permease [Cyclobacteriaceae bacterium]
MNLAENIRVGLVNIRANLLRTILTAMIVAIGICSLVGILTSIDGIQKVINSNMSGLGANSFEIEEQGASGRERRQGVQQKIYPPITLREAFRFVEKFTRSNEISIHADITGTMEVKRFSEKTNPNISLTAANEHFIISKGLDIAEGRNFTSREVQNGINVAIIGDALRESLFETNEDPINQEITFFGTRYRIVGMLAKKGGFSGPGGDRRVLVPLVTGSRLFTWQDPRYRISVFMKDPTEISAAIGDATGIMRSIRKDPIGKENSFSIERSESIADNLDEISGKVRLAGAVVGFITLLGASIALMNIMMVSVTERTREIGVRKALGATAMRIKQQFLIEAVVICILGGTVGIVSGILIGNLVANLIGEGTLIIPWLWMIMGLIVCVGVGLLSGVIPATKAAKLDPIESLRFE